MSRIKQTFANLDRPALITFISAGDPNYEQSLSVLRALPEAGADIIELGMPFTDPAADGLVIQHAGQRALKAGASMHQTLKMVREFRKSNNDTPLVLMGYYNPLIAYGLDKFVTDANAAGIDGLIIVDCPPEESAELEALTSANNIDLIRLLTPTTDEKRLPIVLKGTSGFLYYVSITGVTGTAKPDINTIKPHTTMIKSHTNLPLAIGFGIKTPQDAKTLSAAGDAIVVGSAIVQTIADNQDDPALASKVAAQVSALASAIRA